MELSKNIFKNINIERVAMILLFLFVGFRLLKKLDKTKEQFSMIENMERDEMIEQIDSMNFDELNNFEKVLDNQEEEKVKKSSELDKFFEKKNNLKEFDLLPSNDGDDLEYIEDEIVSEKQFVYDETEFDYGYLESKDTGISSELDFKFEEPTDLLDLQTNEADSIEDETSMIEDDSDKKSSKNTILSSLYELKKGAKQIKSGTSKLAEINNEIEKEKNEFNYDLIEDEFGFDDKIILDELDSEIDTEEIDKPFINNVIDLQDYSPVVKTEKIKKQLTKKEKPKKSKDDNADILSLIENDAYEGSELLFKEEDKSSSAYEGSELLFKDEDKSSIDSNILDDKIASTRIVNAYEESNECLLKDMNPTDSINNEDSDSSDKKFTIDKEGVEKRLKKLKDAGVFIDPTYEEDITYSQMKIDKSDVDYTLDKLNNLRGDNKFDKPVPLSKVYSGSVYKPSGSKTFKDTYKKIGRNLDMNKSASNYYTFDPTKKVNDRVSYDLFKYDNGFTNFQNIE